MPLATRICPYFVRNLRMNLHQESVNKNVDREEII